MNLSWKTARVFISSTFRDMQAERDCLRDIVFPQLDDRLMQLKSHFVPVDLRWGIDTVSESVQEDKEVKVLKVCLNEINRCRPYLLVILGDRYGWIPPSDQISAVVNEAGFDVDTKGKSVTSLEIEYALFSNSELEKRCFFYFRSDLPYERMTEAERAFYSDQYSNESAGRENYNRILALKNRIESDLQLKKRVRYYSVKWENNRISGLESFANQVLEDFWSEFKKDFSYESIETKSSWYEIERQTIAEFIEINSRDFIGHKAVLDSILNWSLNENNNKEWGKCITGFSGNGKSVLYAKLNTELSKRDCLILSHTAGISIRSTSVINMLDRWNAELEGYLNIPEKHNSNGIQTFDNRKELFSRLLEEVDIKIRVICIIDGLEKFERTPIARYLSWLPDEWPKNARFIATAIEGEETTNLSKMSGCHTEQLPLITEQESTKIIQNICERYHKNLHPDIIVSIISKPLSDRITAASNPLWISLVVEHLLLLDEDDFAAIMKLPGTADQKIFRYMLQLVDEFPPDTEDLLHVIFNRFYMRFAARIEVSWMSEMLDLIALSRYGLREKDIQNILGLEDDPSFSLKFALVRRYIRSHIIWRGQQGLIDFSHSHLKSYLRKERLSNIKYKKDLYKKIIEYLEASVDGDTLRQTELMYFYMQIDEPEFAARGIAYYCNDIDDKELDAINKVFEDELAAHSEDETNEAYVWLQKMVYLVDKTFLENRTLEKEVIFRVSLFLIRLSSVILENLSEWLSTNLQLGLLNAIINIADNLNKQQPNRQNILRLLECLYEGEGRIYLEQERCNEAARLFEKSGELLNSLLTDDDENISYFYSLSISLERLGETYSKQANYDLALEYQNKALSLRENLFKTNDNDNHLKHLLGASHNHIGDIYLHKGGLSKAMEHYQKAFGFNLTVFENSADYINAHRLAVTYERIGVTCNNQKRYQQAQENFENALQILKKVNQNRPHQYDILLSISSVYINLIDMFLRNNEIINANEYSQNCFSLLDTMIKRKPDSFRAALHLAGIYHIMGKKLFTIEHYDLALQSYTDGIFMWRQLLVSNPANTKILYALSEEYLGISQIYRKQGSLDKAIENLNEFLEIFTSEETNFTEIDNKLKISSAYRQIAELKKLMGDIMGSMSFSHQDIAFCNELKKSSDNEEIDSNLVESYDRLGELNLCYNKISESLEFHKKAYTLCTELHNRHPKNVTLIRQLAVCCDNISAVYLRSGNISESLNYCAKANEYFYEIQVSDTDNTQYLQDLSVNCERLGNIYNNNGEKEKAQNFYIDSLEYAKRLLKLKPDQLEYLRDILISHYNLAIFYQSYNDLNKSMEYIIQCKENLDSMIEQNMTIDFQSQQIQQQIYQILINNLQ
jgi:tetratricopeptide (TPR) repeat protein